MSRLSLGTIRRIIKEELEAQATADAPLGKYAWPDLRKDIKADEKDTEVETDLLINIQSHFWDEDNPLDKQHAELIKDMMKKGEYKKLLTPPTSSYLFRGMKVDKNFVASKTGLPIDGPKLQKSGFKFGSFVLEPLSGRGSMSFSDDPAAAITFMTGKITSDDGCRVLVRARTRENQGNLLDTKAITKNVQGVNSHATEFETIAFGPIKCDAIYWLPDPNNEFNEFAKLEDMSRVVTSV